MNIYKQISTNKKRTYIIMSLFIVLITFIGYFGGEFLFGRGSGISIMVVSFIFAMISAVFSYYYSDKMVLAISGAKKATRKNYSNLYGILENLCIGTGIKKIPKLYVIEDTAINAFATGRDIEHSSIAVTSGLLEKLNKREIEGVLSHELSHIKNYDIRLMTIVVILVGVISLLANIMLRSWFFKGSDRNNRGNLIIMIVGLFLLLLSPLIAELIKLAISRNREYLADASAALLTRDPKGLAAALRKISHDHEALEVANQATAHLYISNPLKNNKNTIVFANLFNTHPPIRERIRKLESM